MRTVLCCIIALSAAMPLGAETYTWVDSDGTYNFTENYGSIPPKYRTQVKKREDMTREAVPEPISSVPPEPAAEQVPQPAEKKPAAGSGVTGAAAYDSLKRDFAAREATLSELRARIDTMDAGLKRSTADTPARRSLLEERSRAAGRYTELRKEYNLLAESARRNGIAIETR